MIKVYGNELLVSTLQNMIKNNRPPHAVLFYGDKGLGKKTIAKYFSHLLLCDNIIDGHPCFKCKSCRNISADAHPDVIYVEKSGKLGGISVETARHICSDAFIMPNNSDRKIYVFNDCNLLDPRTQNTLLKIIEEPPAHTHFIFTSEAKSIFLDTIISRCICLGVSACDKNECKLALSDMGYSESEINKAVSCFHGNIGLCVDFINNEKTRNIVQLTNNISDSIINKDEYQLNLNLFKVGKDRQTVKFVLELLDKQIRDAVVFSHQDNAEAIGCYKSGAFKLSEMITTSGAIKLHRAINNAWNSVDANVNITLILTALCGEIADIL